MGGLWQVVGVVCWCRVGARQREQHARLGLSRRGGSLASEPTAHLSSARPLPHPHLPRSFTLIPATLGKTPEARIDNLVSILDGYAGKGGHHININVLQKETLIDAMEHPERYPQVSLSYEA